MKKTILVIALCFIFAMAICFGACAVSDDGAVVSVNGVRLNANEVKSGALQAVINDCDAGGRIDVLADFKAPSITLPANRDGDAAKWVINGNGYTLTDSDNTERNSNSHTDFFIEISNSIVEINDLTIKTYASGIRALQTYANITLNNVNVYAGGTVPGTTVTEITTTSASTLKRYAYAIYMRGADDEEDDRYYGRSIDNISLRINGGEYKSIGADGAVMYLRGTSTVVTDGTFVGEDCTFVAWVYGLINSKALSDVNSSLSVHNGMFIRPVSGGKAVGSNNPDAAVGGVIRVTNGALFNAYGGTYVNCDGTQPAEGGKAPNSSVIYCGTSSTAGLAYIYGGEFYQLSEVGSTRGELIAHQLGTMATASDTSAMIDLTRINIWGGKFYYRLGLPNSNIDAIVAAKADASITANDNSTVQRGAWGDFAVSVAEGTTEKTVYGKSYDDLCAVEFSYTGTSSGKALRIKTAEQRTYYTSDSFAAINSIAGNGSTIELIANIESGNKVFALARNISLNINGIGSTYVWKFSNTDYWQGFWWRAGSIKYDGKLRITASGAESAIRAGLPADGVQRPISLTISLGDLRFSGSSDKLYKCVGVAEGSFSTTSSTKVNYSGSSSYKTYKTSESYAANVPKPDIKLKANLTLHSDLTLNFYIPKAGERVKTFTVGDITYNVSEAPVVMIDDVEYYKVSHTRMAAPDAMCSVAYGCTYTSVGGYFTHEASSTYSIVQYATNIQNKDTDAVSKALAAAVVAYMNAAENYFGTSKASAEEIAAMEAFLESYPVDMPSAIADEYGCVTSGIASVISAVTFDLSTSSIRLLLKVADGTKPLCVSVDGVEVLSLDGGHGKGIIEIDLKAYDLTRKITLTSGNLTGTFSLGKYYEGAITASSRQTLKELVIAMYIYGKSAYEYRNYKETGFAATYNIVYGEGNAHAEEMALLVQRYLAAERGLNYAVVSDDTPETDNEILVGATSRTAYTPDCPAGSYAISVSGGKISLYGADDFTVDMAVLYTLENLVAPSGASSLLTVGDGYLEIRSEESSLGAYLQYERLVSDNLTYKREKKYSKFYLYSDGTFTTSSSYVGDGTATKICDMVQTQGACSDGEYIYMVQTDKADGAVGSSSEDHTTICKIDPKTMTVIKRGPIISVRHGNDMTYDSKNDRVLIIWSSGAKASVIDTDEFLESGEANPNYLGVKEDIVFGGGCTYTTLISDGNGGYTTVSLAMHGIGYDEIGDRYVLATSSATSDGYAMLSVVLDDDGYGTVVGIIDTPKTGYTKQGADCDSYYVYHTQSYPSSAADKANTVVVCSWDGEHVRTLKIPYPDSQTNNIEIETIMWIDGMVFMNANRGGSLSLVELAINYNY